MENHPDTHGLNRTIVKHTCKMVRMKLYMYTNENFSLSSADQVSSGHALCGIKWPDLRTFILYLLWHKPTLTPPVARTWFLK